MKNLQKIVLRIVALIGILILFNILYSIFLLEDDLQKHSPMINLVRNLPDNTDILYIGESSNFTYSPLDRDKRSISAFIGDHFPSLVISDITKQATHAGIYKSLLKQIPETSSIKTVVVTLNLRSFNADWMYSALETPLQKSMILLQDYPPLMNRFILSFKGYNTQSNKERNGRIQGHWKNDILIYPHPFPHKNVTEWDDWMAATGIKDSEGNKDNQKTNLACHYIKTYAFQIDTLNHPRIRDFNEIIEHAKKRGWNLVFNLLAENTEEAQQLVGDELVFLMNQNRNVLVDYFTNKDITVVDNLNSVPDDLFIDKTWTTEHYFEQGRQTIAKNVAQSLLKFHDKNYIPENSRKSNQSKFLLDFEKTALWDQEMRLSKEEAFSGVYSSKTSPDSRFSVTFSYPFTEIADSLKNSIHVSSMVKSMRFDKKAVFVLEIKGNDIPTMWVSASLNKLTTTSHDWQKAEHTFILNTSVKNADLVSVYVLNSSKEVVYVDDLEIEFE